MNFGTLARSSVRLAVGALVVAAGLATPALAGSGTFVLDADTVRREGTGEARVRLNKMELEPADLKWANLSDWAGGDALTPDALKGRPVLIITSTGWAPASQGVVRRAAQLGANNKDLVVVVIQTKDRLELATKWLKDQNITVLSARDADGKFRASLGSDQDPDIFVIDRAGQMRFADVESESLTAAVDFVTRESIEIAQAKPAEARRLEADFTAAQNRTRVAGDAIRPGQFGNVAVEFKAPDGGLYGSALWPAKNKQENIQGSNDVQGQQLPFTTEHMFWFNGAPKNTNGKVMVYDYWATWCYPCKRSMPLLEEMAQTFRDELEVIGIMGVNEGRPEIQRWMNANKVTYSHGFDNGEKSIKALSVTAIPTIVVVSSDGVVRWQGNPLQPFFRDIVRQVIEVDPGVKARRDAIRDLRRKGDAAAREQSAGAK